MEEWKWDGTAKKFTPDMGQHDNTTSKTVASQLQKPEFKISSV